MGGKLLILGFYLLIFVSLVGALEDNIIHYSTTTTSSGSSNGMEKDGDSSTSLFISDAGSVSFILDKSYTLQTIRFYHQVDGNGVYYVKIDTNNDGNYDYTVADNIQGQGTCYGGSPSNCPDLWEWKTFEVPNITVYRIQYGTCCGNSVEVRLGEFEAYPSGVTVPAVTTPPLTTPPPITEPPETTPSPTPTPVPTKPPLTNVTTMPEKTVPSSPSTEQKSGDFFWVLFFLIIGSILIVGGLVRDRIRELQDIQELQRLDTKNKLYLMDTYRFETAAAETLKLMGFSQIKQTKRTGDMAVDIFAKKDGYTYVIECKKYRATNKVSRRDLMLLESARNYFTKDKALFVTLSDYSKVALVYARDTGMELITGDELVKIRNEKLEELTKPVAKAHFSKFIDRLATIFYRDKPRTTTYSCNTCGIEVSESDEQCPNCGIKFREYE